MGRPLIDRIGYKIGRLEVINTYRKDKRSYCTCKCECGNVFEVRFDSIKPKGQTRSCGCIHSDIQSGKLKINTTHGLSGHPLYKRWDGIKKRCYNDKKDTYHRYGGRGIKMSEEWKNDFQSFYNWCISNGYEENLTIDRIDVDGNYEPSNCRWVDDETQANNKSTNVRSWVAGEFLTVAQLARKYNVNENTVRGRYKRGLRGKILIKNHEKRNTEVNN